MLPSPPLGSPERPSSLASASMARWTEALPDCAWALLASSLRASSNASTAPTTEEGQ